MLQRAIRVSSAEVLLIRVNIFFKTLLKRNTHLESASAWEAHLAYEIKPSFQNAQMCLLIRTFTLVRFRISHFPLANAY